MKKTFIVLTTLCIVSACGTKEDPGKGPKLGLDPIHLNFENRRDTAIVTAQRIGYSVGGFPVTENGYKSRDTLDDGWIKIITLEDLKQIKVIVDNNDTGDGRFYIAHIYGRNNGEDLYIFQSK